MITSPPITTINKNYSDPAQNALLTMNPSYQQLDPSEFVNFIIPGEPKPFIISSMCVKETFESYAQMLEKVEGFRERGFEWIRSDQTLYKSGAVSHIMQHMQASVFKESIVQKMKYTPLNMLPQKTALDIFHDVFEIANGRISPSLKEECYVFAKKMLKQDLLNHFSLFMQTAVEFDDKKLNKICSSSLRHSTDTPLFPFLKICADFLTAFASSEKIFQIKLMIQNAIMAQREAHTNGAWMKLDTHEDVCAILVCLYEPSQLMHEIGYPRSVLLPLSKHLKEKQTDDPLEMACLYCLSGEMGDKETLESLVSKLEPILLSENANTLQKNFILQTLTLIHLDNKNNELALNYVNQALEIFPNNFFTLGLRGTILLSQDKLLEALEDTEIANNAWPNIFLYVNQLGMIYEKLNRLNDALDVYSVAVLHSRNHDFLIKMRCGEIYLLQKRFKDAGILFQSLIEKEPSNDQALASYGFILCLKEELGGDLFAERALMINPHNIRALQAKSKYLIRDRDLQGALKLLNSIIELSPSVEDLSIRGSVLLDLGEFEKALIDINAVLNKTPLHLNTLMLRVKLLGFQREFDEALTCTDAALIINGQDSEVYHIRAGIFYRQEEFNRALKDLDSSISLLNFDRTMKPEEEKDHHAKLRIFRSTIHVEQGRIEEALNELESWNSFDLRQPYPELLIGIQILDLIKRNKKDKVLLYLDAVLKKYTNKNSDLNCLALYWRAYIKIQEGKISEAQKDLSYQRKDTGTVYQLNGLCRGLLLAKQKKYGEALVVLSLVISLTQNLIPVIARGEVNFIKEDYTKALEDFNQVLNKEPLNENALLYRGAIYKKQKKFAESKRDLDLTLTLNPTNVSALKYRASVFAEESKFDEALQDYQRILELDPKNTSVMIKQGKLLLKIGQQDRALGILTETLKIERNVSAFTVRGQIFAQQNRTKAALQDFDSALLLIDEKLRKSSEKRTLKLKKDKILILRGSLSKNQKKL